MSATRPFRRRLVYIGPALVDGESPRRKEGAARRRLVALSGRCPCGARFELPPAVEASSIRRLTVEHEPRCPAADVAAPDLLLVRCPPRPAEAAS